MSEYHIFCDHSNLYGCAGLLLTASYTFDSGVLVDNTLVIIDKDTAEGVDGINASYHDRDGNTRVRLSFDEHDYQKYTVAQSLLIKNGVDCSDFDLLWP